MATPSRSTLTFDGQALPCVSALVRFTTPATTSGQPNIGAISAEVRCWIDFHDANSVQYSNLQALFNHANVPTKKEIVPIKVEFWSDDSKQDALCTFSFKGWVSSLQMINPVKASATNGSTANEAINHLLIVDLMPAMDDANISSITIGN